MTTVVKPARMPGRLAARAFGSFRPLIIAWAVVAGVMGLTAIVLAVMGPPRSTAKLDHLGPVAALAVAPSAALPETTRSVTAKAAPPEHETAKADPAKPDVAKPEMAKAGAAQPVLRETGSVPPATPPQAPAQAKAAEPVPPLALAGRAIPEPVPGMLETTAEAGPTGPSLPRISVEGRRPEQVYAAFFNPGERHPRVAFVLDGMGLDRGLSEQAMQTLPAGIDFAYSAYAPAATAAALAADGRRRGRECLVSLPMEPSGYPMVDEGTKALLTGAEPENNRRNLQAALAHVQGCVGATGASDGMGGERFAGMQQEFGDVLAELSKRGLLYLDPREPTGPARRSAAAAVRGADLVVDRAADTSSPASPETIDARLAALERRAAERGTAIGVAGPPTPMLIERLAVWSNSLAAHGLVLAPLTAIPMHDPGLGPTPQDNEALH